MKQKKIKKIEKRVKCLILCMGCNDPYYLKQWDNIKQTWAKPILNGEYPDLDILMYTSSGTNEYALDNKHHTLFVPANDSLTGTFEKTCKAIQALNMLNIDYDYILRTNCSTIINVKLLNEFIHSDSFNPIKIYTSELFIGGWKSAPLEDSLIFRGNFTLFNRFYASLINSTSVEMTKQLTDFNRVISKDMFIYDDITIAAIFNTYLLNNNIDKFNVYQRMPIQYLDKIYNGEQPLYANTIAFFNKTFGDDRHISTYYDEQTIRLYDFIEKYYGLLTYDIDKLNDELNDLHYVEKHVAIDEKYAKIEIIKYEDLKKENE